MSAVVELHDPEVIARFARRDAAYHLYELGDLDPFFWPHTRWFGLETGPREIIALALLYSGQALPTLLALGRDDGGAIGELAGAIAERLPQRVYAHLSPGVLERIERHWRAVHHGRHLKMKQCSRERLAGYVEDDIERLGPSNRGEILDLYDRSYPGNWFDVRMLETGQYFGIRRGRRLVCVAGVHVYSPRYRVAALGNITTEPGWRGQGLARRVTARLCRALYEEVDTIGLNVLADNTAAIACYEGLGFEVIGEYEEVLLD